MKFAHFSHVFAKPGMTPGQRYEQLWRELALADEVGFEYGFSVEHHFCPRESLISSGNLYVTGAGARTKRIRLGTMGHLVPTHHPVRLVEEIAITDQMLGGRVEIGLVPGIRREYFGPFKADFDGRRAKTYEFTRFLKAAYAADGPFSFAGETIEQTDLEISVRPAQRPHPPIWMESRDPATLQFAAEQGLHSGYFVLFPRSKARARYEPYVAAWQQHGWAGKPNIGYSTVVFVAETDQAARDIALADAARAYRGFFGDTEDPAELAELQRLRGNYFRSINEPETAEIVEHLLDAEFLLDKELILLGSPATVTRQLRAWAEHGMFNAFFGEFNFGALGEADLMNSIRLFGEQVAPALREFEPF
jgi:alkanesulfonate monooxygenase SsuD/methylene tetrahydromethanopterin reductase-like flavin-dependent oxidoreductase (luciferase family)